MLRAAAEKVGLEQHYSSLEKRMDNNISRAVSVNYSLRSYAILFFAYSFIGWIWEVILFAALQQEFVNTGFFHGPWLPIYGVGGVLATELFKNIRDNPGKTFLSIMVAAGILEYAAHAMSERLFGVTWWDYSDYLLNINGRICIEGLVVFGILGCVSIYIIAPRLNDLVSNIDIKWQNMAISGLAMLFMLDMMMSLMDPNMVNIY